MNADTPIHCPGTIHVYGADMPCEGLAFCLVKFWFTQHTLIGRGDMSRITATLLPTTIALRPTASCPRVAVSTEVLVV